ncbi:hypothetical protein K435DRAFT_514920 [Dendrothele bispora CBS 962.96]|uniref:DUF6593 domain-containing protein n=1 Tax=Dendrothele bispora (strain CBS 962.96) TaxID=1314807 RepID=A0A4S8MA15_DENBC|nr:hypothetical protein K435DRAFT_514920 [Dendrothele bispora CBS 962.96]
MALLVQSREYGDGSEYAVASTNSISSSIDLDIIPSHYIKRLWKKPAIEIPVFTIGSHNNNSSSSSSSQNPNSLTKYKCQYVNKTPNSSDRSVQFSTVQDHQGLVVRHGDTDHGEEIARVQWAPGTNFASTGAVINRERLVEKANVTLGGTKTMHVKDFVKKTGLMGAFSQSRTFTGPDGVEYKWKVIYCGSNPVYPDSVYRELYLKNASKSNGDEGAKFPIATTERLTTRDGAFNVSYT